MKLCKPGPWSMLHFVYDDIAEDVVGVCGIRAVLPLGDGTSEFNAEPKAKPKVIDEVDEAADAFSKPSCTAKPGTKIAKCAPKPGPKPAKLLVPDAVKGALAKLFADEGADVYRTDSEFSDMSEVGDPVCDPPLPAEWPPVHHPSVRKDPLGTGYKLFFGARHVGTLTAWFGRASCKRILHGKECGAAAMKTAVAVPDNELMEWLLRRISLDGSIRMNKTDHARAGAQLRSLYAGAPA